MLTKRRGKTKVGRTKFTYKPPKLSEIEWVEVTTCTGAKTTCKITTCTCGDPECLLISCSAGDFSSWELARFSVLDRESRLCKGNWPFVVEQLVAEGVLK